jgi:hypothetical protein
MSRRGGCHRWGDRWVAASPLDVLRPDEVTDLSEATAEAVEFLGRVERVTARPHNFEESCPRKCGVIRLTDPPFCAEPRNKNYKWEIGR